MADPVPAFQTTRFDLGHGPILPDAAMMDTGRVAVDCYVDRDHFEQEAELFSHVWLNIADLSDVANPGDWIVRDVPSRPASVLITRDGAGVLRAFHNVCRHRGMQLVWAEKGNGTRFSCPYHAWTFDADGALRTVPDAGCFPDLDRDEASLRPIALDVWEGFIFINLDPAPAQSLADFMAPVSAKFQNLPFGRFPRQATFRERLPCNWKLLLEAQSESYHIRALHARTVSAMLSASANPFCHPLYWEALGPHRTWSTAINPAFELSDSRPVQRFAFMASAQIVANADAAGVAEAPPSGFRGSAPIDRGDPAIWAADNLVLFPNCQINAGGNGCWMHRFWPVSETETEWEARYYYVAPAGLRQDFAQQYTTAFNRDTLMEDNCACARQQRMLSSGAVDAIHFGAQEMPCRHNAAVMTAALADA